MEIAQIILPLFGAALCAWAAFQIAGWTNLKSLGLNRLRRKTTKEKRKTKKVTEKPSVLPARIISGPNTWQGFRSFKVAALEPETDDCTSVYLVPSDEKPLAGFKPGQHLTLRFEVEEGAKPVVRCYSLSSSFHPSCYRISVKAVSAPEQTDLPAGRVSNFVNSRLRVGHQVDVKAPAGAFFIDDSIETPLVLLAAGVGITPMMSMIETMITENSRRAVMLLYGVTDSSQHIFGKRLKTISLENQNISVINCYSQPLTTDRANADYQVRGRVSAELLGKVLPRTDLDFYLCGPPPFMESIYDALHKMEVTDERIHFEAFGPATVKRVAENRVSDVEKPVESIAHQITFAASESSATWTPQHSSLLEVAESSAVMIDSGCRAGSCGTCETGLLSGTVEYPGHAAVSCSVGKCLPCVAVPSSDVELEA